MEPRPSDITQDDIDDLSYEAEYSMVEQDESRTKTAPPKNRLKIRFLGKKCNDETI